jgi:hypothetical protein
MKVLDLNDYFDGYGIIADCKDEDGNLVNFTLCDLRAEDKEHPNWDWLERYGYWFTNR